MERWQGKCQGVDKGRNCGLAVGCAGEEFHQRWQLHTWLWRKVRRWSTTKEIGIGAKAVVVALVSRRGRGKRKREILRSVKEKWRPAEGRKRRMYRRKRRRNGRPKGGREEDIERILETQRGLFRGYLRSSW